ncbi:putative ubiquinone biosynthesis monooxygenase coq6 [Erysiphe necator]|uniref:Ubiquinone biosynthesis monooxygenase COQ6, mitochondrial n=1 Tax=Uncinula necator TaxID=52586 RepID=A0A0B1PAN9_UNCNE|nr:putative ubiquinone biosynthesis monooxygenase coq6 [Erysiphe necator]
MNNQNVCFLRSLTCHIRPQKRCYIPSPRRQTQIFDIVCVGGGTAGLSLLAALRSSPVTANLKMALIERQDLQATRLFSLPSHQFSSRCSSLTPSSVRFLEQIGVWKHMKLDRIQPYHEMQVWDGVSGARIEFNWQDPERGSTIAYMTENLNLASALIKRIEDLGGISIFENQAVSTINLGEESEDIDLSGWPILQLSSGKKLAARLLVGADGAKSLVRSFAGIDSKGWDYNRVGVVATLKSESAGYHKKGLKTAYQRFLPTGPVAMLPLPECYSTLVWTTTPERASHLKDLCSEDFIAMVNASFRLSPIDLSYMHTIESKKAEEVDWRSQHAKFNLQLIPPKVTALQCGSIASFPLKLRHADSYIGERVVLIGDAAHSIHPLAGQGLNQGQADVESLVAKIIHSVSHGEDIGVKMALEAYNSERYAANNILLGVVDNLHKLYSVENGPLVLLRSIGLKAVNSSALVKNFFMEHAAGTGRNRYHEGAPF